MTDFSLYFCYAMMYLPAPAPAGSGNGARPVKGARRQFVHVGFPCLVSFFARTTNITVKAVPATIQDAI